MVEYEFVVDSTISTFSIHTHNLTQTYFGERGREQERERAQATHLSLTQMYAWTRWISSTQLKHQLYTMCRLAFIYHFTIYFVVLSHFNRRWGQTHSHSYTCTMHNAHIYILHVSKVHILISMFYGLIDFPVNMDRAMWDNIGHNDGKKNN